MNINPLNPSNYSPHVSASGSVDTGAGGGGGGYVGGGRREEKEQVDEVTFETQENNFDSANKNLWALIVDFFVMLWEGFLRVLGFKKDQS